MNTAGVDGVREPKRRGGQRNQARRGLGWKSFQDERKEPSTALSKKGLEKTKKKKKKSPKRHFWGGLIAASE